MIAGPGQGWLSAESGGRFSMCARYCTPLLFCLKGSQVGGQMPLRSSMRASRAGETLVTVQVSGSLAANNSESLRDAALSGLGIALLPDFTAQSHLQSGKLQLVLPKWRSVRAFAAQLHLVRPYTPHVPRAVALLVTHLRHSFADGFDTTAKGAAT